MVKPAGRARRIAMPPRDLARGSDEAVFKLMSTTKSRAEAKGMVRYVARARKSGSDDPTVAAVKLRDGEGEVLSRTDAAESFAGVRAAVDGAFEGLELTPEAENLKKDAAPAPPAAPPAGDLEPAPEVEPELAQCSGVRPASFLKNATCTPRVVVPSGGRQVRPLCPEHRRGAGVAVEQVHDTPAPLLDQVVLPDHVVPADATGELEGAEDDVIRVGRDISGEVGLVVMGRPQRLQTLAPVDELLLPALLVGLDIPEAFLAVLPEPVAVRGV